jgi:hypothetical protein
VPAGNQYRVNVEKWFTYMKKVANDTTDIRKIEDEIAVGQIEEIITMAADELELIDTYVDSKGWELVVEEQKRADTMIEGMKDTIYFSNPEEPAPEEGAEEKK